MAKNANPLPNDGAIEIDSRVISYLTVDCEEMFVLHFQLCGDLAKDGLMSGEIAVQLIVRDRDTTTHQQVSDATKAFVATLNRIITTKPKGK